MSANKEAAKHARQFGAEPERLIPWLELRPMTGNVSRTTWWRAVKRGDAPAPVSTTIGRKAWRESDIVAWQAARTSGKEAA